MSCISKSKSPSGCGTNAPVSNLRTFQDLIDDYMENYYGRLIAELDLTNCPDDAVCGVNVRLDNTKNPPVYVVDSKPNVHQKRLPKPILTGCTNALKQDNIMSKKFNDFEELFDYIVDLFKPYFKNVGLVHYDTAKRIGWHMNPKVLPKKYVYIFRGAETGLKHLINNGVIKSSDYDRKNHRILTSKLQKIFPGMDSLFIEDMLCIYKDQLKQIKTNTNSKP